MNTRGSLPDAMRDSYDWKNDSFWTVAISEKDFAGYMEPYIGNGLVGFRLGPLGVGTDPAKPLRTHAKIAYDRDLIELPAWQQIYLRVGGCAWTPELGKHAVRHEIDLRTARFSLRDSWEYAPGKVAQIEVKLDAFRARPHMTALSIVVTATDDLVEIDFGLDASSLPESWKAEFTRPESNLILGEYLTGEFRREVAQAIRWRTSGTTTDEGGARRATLRTTAQGSLNLFLCHVVHSYAEGQNAAERARTDAARIDPGELEEIIAASDARWRDLWSRALAFEHPDAAVVKQVLLHQFYLLCSLNDPGTGAWPTAPLGLTGNNWGGGQMWDSDFFVFRAALALWPELARPIVEYRRRTLQAARENAEASGYGGAWFPHQARDSGEDRTTAHYRQELQVNIWIALAAREYAASSKDGQFLRETAYPLLAGIADFFCSRAEWDGSGHCHLRGVVGADEYVCEHGPGTCDDNPLTNWGVRCLLGWALEAAAALNEKPPRNWGEVRDALVILPARGDGVIPEYEGYSDAPIKQADIILMFYPLNYPASREQVLANLEYYGKRIVANGPQMTTQIEAILLMRHGQRERGLRHLLETTALFNYGPHALPCEGPSRKLSLFITGIGGELQALIYGWYGATLDDLSKLPRIGQQPGF